jgi:hypothetical protein
LDKENVRSGSGTEDGDANNADDIDEGGEESASKRKSSVGFTVGIPIAVLLCGLVGAFAFVGKKGSNDNADWEKDEEKQNTIPLEDNPKSKKSLNSVAAFSNPAYYEGSTPASIVYAIPIEVGTGGDANWYVPQMNKAECKTQVFGASTGDFLVRDSRTHPGSYAICINLGNGRVQEDLIKRGQSGTYTIKFCKDQSFPDLVTLVQHCQTHSVSPKHDITLKLGQPAGVVYSDPSSAMVGASVDDSIYGCQYGEVDSGLLNFFTRVVAVQAEIYDALVENPLTLMAGMKAVSLPIALQTAATHCGSVDNAFLHAKQLATEKAKLISLFPRLNVRFIEVILMYTANSQLYKMMNAAFGGYGKEKGRAMAIHYLPYAQLLISAVKCLPEVQMIVYRGVQMSHTLLLNGSKVGDTITWWPFVSTTGSPKVLRKKAFFDAVVKIDKLTGKVVGVENNSNIYESNPTKVKHKTIFVIITLAGYHIVGFSAFEDEDEYLLLPGSKFLIERIKTWHNGITEVRLRQVASPYSLSARKKGSSSATRRKIQGEAADELIYGEIDVYMAPDSKEEVYEPMDVGSSIVYSMSSNTGVYGAGNSNNMYGDALC